MDLPNQDDVYYCGEWSRELETTVLNKLHLYRLRGDWKPKNYPVNVGVLREVRAEMITEGTRLDLVVYYRKEAQWEQRYSNFKWLLSQPGVHYDAKNNRVSASRRSWVSIVNICPEMLIYHDEGEINWEILECLYKEIIQISSTMQFTSSDDALSSNSGVVDQPGYGVWMLKDYNSDSF